MKVALWLILVLAAQSDMAHARSNPVREASVHQARFEPLVQIAASNQRQISAGKAAKLVKSKYGGKVLSVKSVKTDAGTDYRVKVLLDSGVVKLVSVSGKSGKIN